MTTNEQFFDEAAEYYNEMVDFDTALEKREKGLKNFIRNDMQTAADIGCGTGLDSISMAMNGLKVTAFDLSAEMLKQAAAKAAKRSLDISFIKSSADNIPLGYNDKFSLVVSLGNTFANLSKEQLFNSIGRCYHLLNRDGILLIQVLNFSRILKDKERIINITASGNNFYIRFYDFLSESFNFNILKFNSEQTNERSLVTTKLYPHSYQEITEHLQQTGFTDIKLWENFNRKLFEPASSKDLIIEAVK